MCWFHCALRNDVRTIYIIVGAYVCRFGTTTQKKGDSIKYFWSGDDKLCGNNESDLKMIMICYTRYNSTSRVWRAERAFLGDRERQNRAMQVSSISGSFSPDVNFNTCVRVRIPFPSPVTASSFASIFPAIHGPSKLCAAATHYAFIMATI